LNRDFGYSAEPAQWAYWGPGGKRSGLAHPALRGGMQLRNAAAAMCALDALKDRLPTAMQDVRRGLAEVALPGRFQTLPGRPQVILDVAHNVEAAKTLAHNLGGTGFAPETIAVCGMLRDKDIAGVLAEMAPRVTRWHLCSLAGPRAATARELEGALRSIDSRVPVFTYDSPSQAFAAAQAAANENDKIVVFGSFFTVGESITWLNSNKTSTR
jgi:dihydrofolate synthase/folylpolyglutamate synthase